MKRLRTLLASLVAVFYIFISNVSYATPVLSFENSGGDIKKSYFVGDTIALDLWISGLDGTDISGGADLGGFDMNLSFNGNVTQYQQTTFSSDLDDSLFFGLAADQTSNNTLNNYGVSLEWDLAGQASSFKLFTLVFSANQLGTSIVNLDNFLLSDSMANELFSDSFFAEINVVEKITSVPEPRSVLLLLGALMLVVMRRRMVV